MVLTDALDRIQVYWGCMGKRMRGIGGLGMVNEKGKEVGRNMPQADKAASTSQRLLTVCSIHSHVARILCLLFPNLLALQHFT